MCGIVLGLTLDVLALEPYGGFRSGMRCLNQISTLKQIGEKAHERKPTVYVGSIDVQKVYAWINRKAL